MSLIHPPRRPRRMGAAAVEYAFLIMLVALAAIAGMSLIGPKIGQVLRMITDFL